MPYIIWMEHYLLVEAAVQNLLVCLGICMESAGQIVEICRCFQWDLRSGHRFESCRQDAMKLECTNCQAAEFCGGQ